MSNNDLIKMWKNPELRNIQDDTNHPSGTPFSELSSQEMSSIYGASSQGDVQPMSTFPCGALVSLVGSYLASRNLPKC